MIYLYSRLLHNFDRLTATLTNEIRLKGIWAIDFTFCIRYVSMASKTTNRRWKFSFSELYSKLSSSTQSRDERTVFSELGHSVCVLINWNQSILPFVNDVFWSVVNLISRLTWNKKNYLVNISRSKFNLN